MSLLAIAMLAFLQATTMEGIVTKPSGVEPLPGARVTLRATNRETPSFNPVVLWRNVRAT